MEYMSVSEAAAKWKIPANTIQKYCREGVIPNVRQERKGSPWCIPVDAVPPSGESKAKQLTVMEPCIDNADTNLKKIVYQELTEEHKKLENEIQSLVSQRNKKNSSKIQPQINARLARKEWIETILKKYELGGKVR